MPQGWFKYTLVLGQSHIAQEFATNDTKAQTRQQSERGRSLTKGPNMEVAAEGSNVQQYSALQTKSMHICNNIYGACVPFHGLLDVLLYGCDWLCTFGGSWCLI